ncbi:MAG: sialidase family protein [Gammaproteobacteria bacterium]
MPAYSSRRSLLKGLLGSAAAMALGRTAHGADHAHMAAPKNALGTSAAFDAQGRLWTASVEADNIVLRSTSDAGKTWSAPVAVLHAPAPIEAAGESRPKIAFGPQGDLYLTYTRPLAKPYTGDIRFVRSQDGGRSFSEPVTVQRDRGVITHRFDSLLVDRQGRIHVAWVDKRDGEAARAAGRSYRGAAIYYAVSSDRGASFGTDVKLAEHSCECCRIALALDGGGNVVGLWRHVFEPNIRDHALAVLKPGGPAAPQRVSFENWHIDACPHHGPSLAFDGRGRRHQVWFNAASDEGGLFYASAAGGDKPKPQRIGGPLAEHGEVAVAGDLVAIVWKEFDGSATRIKARVSSNAGRTWSEADVAATQGASDHPHLVTRGGEAWLVWRTADDGTRVVRIGGQA